MPPTHKPRRCEKRRNAQLRVQGLVRRPRLTSRPTPSLLQLAFVALSSKFPCAACHSMPLCPVVKLQVHATPPTPEALPAISAVIVPSSVPSVAKSSLLKSLTGDAYDRRTADGSSATAASLDAITLDVASRKQDAATASAVELCREGTGVASHPERDLACGEASLDCPQCLPPDLQGLSSKGHLALKRSEHDRLLTRIPEQECQAAHNCLGVKPECPKAGYPFVTRQTASAQARRAGGRCSVALTESVPRSSSLRGGLAHAATSLLRTQAPAYFRVQ